MAGFSQFRNTQFRNYKIKNENISTQNIHRLKITFQVNCNIHIFFIFHIAFLFLFFCWISEHLSFVSQWQTSKQKTSKKRFDLNPPRWMWKKLKVFYMFGSSKFCLFRYFCCVILWSQMKIVFKKLIHWKLWYCNYWLMPLSVLC